MKWGIKCEWTERGLPCCDWLRTKDARIAVEFDSKFDAVDKLVDIDFPIGVTAKATPMVGI